MVNPKPDQDAAPSSNGASTDAHDDRRKHRRVELPVKARFLTEKGVECAAEVLNISAAGAMLRTKFPPSLGQSLVLYIDQIGRVEAKVVRSSNNSFAVTYPKRRAKQAKIADNITSAINNRHAGADRRTNPRIQQDAPATVLLEDGREVKCSIMDISLTGASLDISPRPPLGTHLVLGRMTAKVVRRHDKGVGVVFTGSAKRMDDVVEETTAIEPLETFDATGAGFAQRFGKKGVRAGNE
ncbi:PilZ domain-containing protein [Hyphococcus sp.]|uniref:PilZ domain-containing protein n=1 Tax=Hyphococcus sp. TaxID=2038636 RepID=UPI0035C672CB